MLVRRFNNRLGVKGWIYGGRYNIERTLYILHRISGLGILLYLIMHIFVTSVRLKGAEAWEPIMSAFHHPLFVFGEYLVVAAAIFHGFNGIRLIVIELGMLIGKPKRPEYPYVTSIMRQRPFAFVMMGLAAIFLLVATLEFYVF